jgi:outer membrane protein
VAINSNQILVDKSKLDYVPNLSISTDYQLNISRSLDPVSYDFIKNTNVNTVNPGLYLSTTVFDGFRRYNNYRKILSDLEVSKADLDALKNNLTLSVTISYMNVQLNREVINSIQRQIEISESNIHKTQRLIEEGMATDENLQNILVQFDNEKYSFADAEGNLKNAIINLCSLLNLKDYNSFEVEDSISFEDENIILKDIITSALFLPQIESVKWKINSSNYVLKIAQSDFYPTVTFGTSLTSSFSDARKRILLDENENPLMVNNQIRYGNYHLFDQWNNHRYGLISLTFSFPVSNFFQIRKNVSLAKNEIMQSKINLKIAEKNLFERINQLFSEVEIARKKYKTSLSSVEHYEKLLFHTNQKLENGVLTSNDYIVIKNNLLISDAQASKAKYEYYLKIKLLKYYGSME